LSLQNVRKPCILYRKQECTSFDIAPLGLNKLSQEEMLRLEEPVIREEIRRLLLAVIHPKHRDIMRLI